MRTALPRRRPMVSEPAPSPGGSSSAGRRPGHVRRARAVSHNTGGSGPPRGAARGGAGASGQPDHAGTGGAGAPALLGSDSLGSERRGLRDLSPSGFGYSDGLDLSIGANGVGLGSARAFLPGHPARPVKRNSQTILNVGFNGLSTAPRPTRSRRPRRCSGISGSAASRRRRWSRSRRSTRCAARRIAEDTCRVRGRVAAQRQRRVPPAVRARVRRTRPRSTSRTSGARPGGLRADARRREFAVRSLHAR